MRSGDYAIVIEGEFEDDLRAEFAPLEIATRDGRTTLTAIALDQAALHGLLERARSLGLVLIDVHRLDQTG